MTNNKIIQSCLQACADWGLIPTSFRQCMTWEEQVLWLSKFLQEQVIPAVNRNTEGLQELKAYVDNYFENLDLTEEVDAKLEQMAESGQLADIIAEYVQLRGIFAFDTVADMKASESFVNGSFAETYGFYAKGDGGSAKYKIRTITNDDVIDDMFLFEITGDPGNTLVAELIEGERINAKQVGITGDGETNETTKIAALLNHNTPVYFPAGTYLLDETTTITTQTVDITGDGVRTIFNSYGTGESLAAPIIDFSGASNIYLDGITTTNSAFKVYSGGTDYAEDMKNKNVFLRNVLCSTVDADVNNKTSWGLFINNKAPLSYSSQYVDGSYVTYPLEITNHSGYNAININNWCTDANGDPAAVPDNSAIGITDKVSSSAPVIYIDKYSSRATLRVDRRDADSKYRQDNTVFEMNQNGNLALGCRNTPDARLTGYATLKLHAESPAVMFYKDDGTNVYNGLMSYDRSNDYTDKYFKFNAGGYDSYITNNGVTTVSRPGSEIQAIPAATIRPGTMIWSSTLKKPLWFNGTVWIDAAGTTMITPTS